ncbi:N-6 DNA methylase [Thiorhodovibrio frisius]
MTPTNAKSLESWIWNAACSIRGAKDAPKYKDYILPLIFTKRLCDVFDDELNRIAAEVGSRRKAFALAKADHKLVRFYLPLVPADPEQPVWSVIRKLSDRIGEGVTTQMRAIARDNPLLQGIIDRVDFNATTHGQRDLDDDRLSNLIEAISTKRLGLDDVEADIIGKSYEYLIIHDFEGEIEIGDTFKHPKFRWRGRLRTFDRVVANPMWNQNWFTEADYDNDELDRFPAGAGFPGKSSADWGWVQHMHASLNDKGRAAVVLDTGAASRGSGNAGTNKEKTVRQWFVDHDLIESVLYLPENLFYNTTAPGIVLFLNKAKPEARRGKVFLVNASQIFEKGDPRTLSPLLASSASPTPSSAGRKRKSSAASSITPSLRRTTTTSPPAAASTPATLRPIDHWRRSSPNWMRRRPRRARPMLRCGRFCGRLGYEHGSVRRGISGYGNCRRTAATIGVDPFSNPHPAERPTQAGVLRRKVPRNGPWARPTRRRGTSPIFPESVIRRRFVAGWYHFEHLYRPRLDAWRVYDNSGEEATLLEEAP